MKDKIILTSLFLIACFTPQTINASLVMLSLVLCLLAFQIITFKTERQ